MIEIEMLEMLCKHDIGGDCCVQIWNWFDYRKGTSGYNSND
ncbi:unnamed protein product [Rhodiola kirilowii]